MDNTRVTEACDARRGQRHTCRYCSAVINRYESGLSVVETSAAVGISAHSVYMMLLRHGVALRHRAEQGRYRRITWGDEAERRYRAGATLRKLSAAFGVSSERVRQVLRERGVTKSDRPHPHRCDAICDAILAAAPPVNINETARRLGCGSETVVKRARHHGVPYGARRKVYMSGRRRHVCDDRCERFRALLAAGTPRTHIGALLGLKSTHTSVIFPANHPEWPWFDGRKTRKAEGSAT